MIQDEAPVLVPRPSTTHFRDLDGMRGVLSLGVALFHFGLNAFFERQFGWHGLSLRLCVDVFFLLSGYVLTHSVRGGGTNRARFVYRRFMRLAPVYFVTTVALAIALGTMVPPLDWPAASPFTGAQPLNGPAWSICWEFYLPVLAVIAGLRVPDRLVWPALIVALFALGWVDRDLATVDGNYFPRAVFGLLAGHLLYRSGARCDWPFLPLVVGIVALMALASYSMFGALLLPPLACVAILAGRRGGSIFGWRVFQWLGDLSYTLYMAHVPVLLVMLDRFGDAAKANSAAKLAGLAVAIVLALALTVLVERPGIRLGRYWPAARA